MIHDKNALSAEQKKLILNHAVEIRQFEIGLFWQRSLFFWGLVAAAFVAYAELSKDHMDLALIVSCFGFVCSIAWSLVNRGSKYWQEAWEQKVGSIEHEVLGCSLFQHRELRQNKGTWLSARQYSVSKLAIALSDFSVLIWAVLIGAAMNTIGWSCGKGWFLIAGSIAFVICMFRFGKSSE